MMNVLVQRGDIKMYCTTQEQLESFLEDGYVEVKETKAPAKATRKEKKQTV